MAIVSDLSAIGLQNPREVGIYLPEYYKTRGSWDLWNLPRVSNYGLKDLMLLL